MNGMNVQSDEEPGMTPMAIDWKDRLNSYLEKAYAESKVPKFRDPQALEAENTLQVDPSKQRMNTALWAGQAFLAPPAGGAPPRQQGMASPKALRMQRLENRKLLGNAADPYIAQFFKQGLWHGGRNEPPEQWKPPPHSARWGEPTAVSTSMSRAISSDFGEQLYRVGPKFYPHQVVPSYSKEGQSIILQAYELALMNWMRKYPRVAAHGLQDPNYFKNLGGGHNRNFNNEFARAFQQLGYKGIAYPPQRFGEWELAIFDAPKNAEFYPVTAPNLGKTRTRVRSVDKQIDYKGKHPEWTPGPGEAHPWYNRTPILPPAPPEAITLYGDTAGGLGELVFRPNKDRMDAFRRAALAEAQLLAPDVPKWEPGTPLSMGPKSATQEPPFVPKPNIPGAAQHFKAGDGADKFWEQLTNTFGHDVAAQWWTKGILPTPTEQTQAVWQQTPKPSLQPKSGPFKVTPGQAGKYHPAGKDEYYNKLAAIYGGAAAVEWWEQGKLPKEVMDTMAKAAAHKPPVPEQTLKSIVSGKKDPGPAPKSPYTDANPQTGEYMIKDLALTLKYPRHLVTTKAGKVLPAEYVNNPGAAAGLDPFEYLPDYVDFMHSIGAPKVADYNGWEYYKKEWKKGPIKEYDTFGQWLYYVTGGGK